ncbi:hypothetical protein RSAG8_02280, partial [Rhizoctonia solani AG-8 WAC10335]
MEADRLRCRGTSEGADATCPETALARSFWFDFWVAIPNVSSISYSSRLIFLF